MELTTTNNNGYIITAKQYKDIVKHLNEIAAICHGASVAAGWYNNIQTGERIDRNVPEMMMLAVSEIAEAMEGYRKNSMDDKLPNRKMVMVEFGDAMIRLFDTCAYLASLPEFEGDDIGNCFAEKLFYNQNRADHKIENRKKENGKKF